MSDRQSVKQEQLSRRQEAVALLVGRLAVFCGDTPPRRLLAAQLLSHAYSHGPAVEAATKEVARCMAPSWLARLSDCLPGFW
jgi:hypothetical protein